MTDTGKIAYTAQDYTHTIPAEEYIRRFRDAGRFIEYCRQCPNYNRSWGCPPLSPELQRHLCGYRNMLIIATKITPRDKDIPLSESRRLILPERVRLERRLLEMERIYNGRAFAYVGTCLYCPEGTCTRPQGLECRHPELVRPSLEAYGFDIGRTTSELFGLDLVWGKDGKLPPYLILVCGFLHNSDSVAF